MNHKHVGDPEYACPGCFQEVRGEAAAARRKTVAGLVILIVLVIGSMALLSWYLTKHGSHLG